MMNWRRPRRADPPPEPTTEAPRPSALPAVLSLQKGIGCLTQNVSLLGLMLTERELSDEQMAAVLKQVVELHGQIERICEAVSVIGNGLPAPALSPLVRAEPEGHPHA